MTTNMREDDATWERRRTWAGYIRAGARLIEENQIMYLQLEDADGPACGCALGTAWVGMIGEVRFPPAQHTGIMEDIITGIPDLSTRVPESVRDNAKEQFDAMHLGFLTWGGINTWGNLIETLHCYSIPRLHIATWLETGVFPTRGETS